MIRNPLRTHRLVLLRPGKLIFSMPTITHDETSHKNSARAPISGSSRFPLFPVYRPSSISTNACILTLVRASTGPGLSPSTMRIGTRIFSRSIRSSI